MPRGEIYHWTAPALRGVVSPEMVQTTRCGALQARARDEDADCRGPLAAPPIIARDSFPATDSTTSLCCVSTASLSRQVPSARWAR